MGNLPRLEGCVMETGESTKSSLWRWTPAASALAVAAVALLVWNFKVVSDTERANAKDQEAIDGAVAVFNNDLNREFWANMQKTNELLNPLNEALGLDKALKEAGLPPQSGRDFYRFLETRNRSLLASGGAKRIDTCEQVVQVEMHFLYEGGRRPKKGLPGWAPNWQTECMRLLPEDPKE